MPGKIPRGTARKKRRERKLLAAGVYTSKALHDAFHPQSEPRRGLGLINSDGASREFDRRPEYPRPKSGKCKVCGNSAIHGEDICKDHIK